MAYRNPGHRRTGAASTCGVELTFAETGDTREVVIRSVFVPELIGAASDYDIGWEAERKLYAALAACEQDPSDGPVPQVLVAAIEAAFPDQIESAIMEAF